MNKMGEKHSREEEYVREIIFRGKKIIVGGNNMSQARYVIWSPQIASAGWKLKNKFWFFSLNLTHIIITEKKYAQDRKQKK